MKRRWWVAAYMLTLAVVLLAPLASSEPDGLERVAANEGFADSARDAPYSAMAGYLFPGIGNDTVAGLLAGWVGVTVIFLLAGGLTLTAQWRRTRHR